MSNKTFISDLSQTAFPLSERVSVKSIREKLFFYIQKKYPHLSPESYISLSEYNTFRETYISDFLTQELGELNDLEQKVLKSFQNHSLVCDTTHVQKDASLTFGQKVADYVADFGGSWTFIISFVIFLIVWIILNVTWFHNQGFDPYPFILLNLILSCIAALQAPIIMMSQNRQEEKDRLRAQNDYMVNLKSEIEIRMLHEKIDHLMLHQQEELLQIQKIQIDILEDILQQLHKK